MIKELANVIAVDTDNITVSSQIKSTCSGCAQVKTCGSGQIAKALPQASLTLTLPYDNTSLENSLEVGDCVVIALPEEHILSSASQVYLWPLLGLIVFSAVGQFLFKQQVLPHELFALGFGLIGGYLGYRIAKYQQNQGERSASLQPKIIEIIPSATIIK